MTRQNQIAILVRMAVETGHGGSFDQLLLSVERCVPDITATEVDQAARPYEAGEPEAASWRAWWAWPRASRP